MPNQVNDENVGLLKQLVTTVQKKNDKEKVDNSIKMKLAKVIGVDEDTYKVFVYFIDDIEQNAYTFYNKSGEVLSEGDNVRVYYTTNPAKGWIGARCGEPNIKEPENAENPISPFSPLTEYHYLTDTSVKFNGTTYTVEKDTDTGLISKISDSNGNSLEPTINSGITDVALHNAVFMAAAVCRGISKLNTMPIMDGITGYFDIKHDVTSTVWRNYLAGNNILLSGSPEITGEYIKMPVGTYGSLVSGEQPKIIYSVYCTEAVTNPELGGLDGWQHIISTKKSVSTKGSSFCISTSDKNTIALGGQNKDVISNISPLYIYHVVAIVRDGSNGMLYIDGDLIGSIDLIDTGYDGFVYLCYYRDVIGGTYCTSLIPVSFKFAAFGNTPHSALQIAKNSEWLRKYYELDEPKFVAGGIMGLFTPETRDIANSRWRNSISGYNDMTLKGGSVSENAVHFNAGEYGSFVCDEPNTVYTIAKMAFKSADDETWFPFISKHLLNGTRHAGFDLFSLYKGSSANENIISFSGVDADIASDINSKEYHVCCYTRKNNTAYLYIDGNYIGNRTGLVSGQYSGDMLINMSNRGGSIPSNNSLGDTDMIMCAFGTSYHDEATVRKNMAYLANKYLGAVH